MSKELPYFKFFVNEWITGDITLEDFEAQGLFINICAYYWSKNCRISFTNAKRKFKNASETSFQSLIDSKIIKVGKDDLLIISFLDEQNIERNRLSKTNSENGKKGGAPKGNKNAKTTEIQPIALNNLTKTQPKTTNKEKKREEVVSIKDTIIISEGHPYSRLPEGDARRERYLTDEIYRKDIDFQINNPI